MSYLVSERKILIEFYHSTKGPEWTSSANWCSEEPLSQWRGVSVEGGRVVKIDLRENGLKGKALI